MTAPVSTHLTARDGTRLAIRPLTVDEVGALQRFDAGLSTTTRALFLPHAYDAATLLRYAARHHSGQDLILLLMRASEVAGYFFLWEFDQPVPLLGLGLADAWQGRGLGEPMLRHLIAVADAAGRSGLELTTVTSNTRALHLYRKVGFQPWGEVENIAGDGRRVREYRLFLPLQPGALPPPRTFQAPV
jgi:ribosomal protein S18 acetylase RimI-like enzyme